jgi:ubiquinone/menaquinone biosynthesis C-methylase UbiE
MYEIYDHHADRYDALISREDCDGNLRRALRDAADWNGAVVAEAGIGTGRITGIYIDLVSQVLGFDRAVHMLERAAVNLAPWRGKLRLAPAPHFSLPMPDARADIFVEGWAFGHAVIDQAPDVAGATDSLLAEATRVTRPGGTILVIESLGTNVDVPAAPDPALDAFYQELERRGFERSVITTDYRFSSRDEAAELCGFFFGGEMGAAVQRRLEQTEKAAPGGGGLVVPEFTGIWRRAR